MDALVDVVRLQLQVFQGVGLQAAELLQVFVQRQVGLADEAVALHFAEYEISDLIMHHPVLLLVNVVLILHLLLHVPVDLRKIDDVIVDHGKVLVLEGVDGLADAVLICQEVAFFEVDVLLDYAL